MKIWKIGEPDQRLALEFKRKCNLSLLTLKVLTARGYADFQDIVDYFNDAELSDPFMMKDMQAAVDTISQAVDNYSLICIYGDYDCDGITSTAILYNYLDSMGANVMYYIPEREDGYGMNIKAVRDLAERGVELIVTVDNGISAVEEAEEIARLGMKLVITDHHQPSETLPRAEAVVDPHRRDCPSVYKNLCGAGVALKLCAALDGGNYDMILEQYSDICALGTVADVVPLDGENRSIVRHGLLYMKNSENHGLNFLIDRSGVKRDNLSAGNIAFRLAPSINASGRFGSPTTAVKALLAEDEDDAESYVDTMISLNDLRKDAEAGIMNDIMRYIDENPEVLDQRVLVLSGEGWHHGVVGIVSARIMERFGKPAVLLSIDGDMARGSARSIPGFNIFKCFSYAQELLDRFGGHECAGGLSLKAENIEAFRRKVYEYAAAMEQMPSATVSCDLRIDPNEITVDNVKSLSVMEPFGAGNPQPVFVITGARVDRIYSLSQGKHTKLEVVCSGGGRLQALMFSQDPQLLNFGVDSTVDLAVQLSVDEYNGRESVSVKVVDCRPTGISQEKYFAAKDTYEKYRRGESLPAAFMKKINPDRQELVEIYKYISKAKEITVDDLFMRINKPAVNYCKLRLCVDAFCELGLADFVPSSQRVRILPVTARVDIESAPTLTELRKYL